jgi:LmbE family N-acetylglucosaminyl deacetylase
MTTTTERSIPARVLVVAAHPDDPEFGFGGTAATWTAAGSEVFYVVCSRGDKGSEDPSMCAARLMQMRQAEQRDAAAVLGVKEVRFLEFRDGELTPNLDLRKAIVRAIREIKPDAVVTHDPATLYGTDYINHPDHRAVGQAALDAVFPTARDRLQFPEHESEGLLAHKVLDVFMWGSLSPNYFVDISAGFDKKIESLLRHTSQVGKGDGLADRLRERATLLGEPQNIPLAESFRHIALRR